MTTISKQLPKLAHPLDHCLVLTHSLNCGLHLLPTTQTLSLTVCHDLMTLRSNCVSYWVMNDPNLWWKPAVSVWVCKKAKACLSCTTDNLKDSENCLILWRERQTASQFSVCLQRKVSRSLMLSNAMGIDGLCVGWEAAEATAFMSYLYKHIH